MKQFFSLFIGVCLFVSCTKREISSLQAEQFLKYFGTSGTDEPGDVTLSGDGYVMLGSEWGVAGQTVYLYIIDKNGNIEAKTQVNDSLDCTASAMAEISAGGFYVCGNSYNSYGYSDVFLAKIHADYSVDWMRYYGGKYDESVNSISVDQAGNILLAGAVSASEERDAEATDILLMKVDAQGDSLWAKSFGGSRADEAYGIAVLPSGNVSIVGATSSYKDAGQDESNIIVLTVNENGFLLDRATYGGDGDDYGYAVCSSNDGALYVAGVKENELGDADVWVARFDQSIHAPVWEKTEGDVRDDYCFSISQSQGKLLLAGYTRDLQTRNKDVLVLEYSVDGEKQNQYVTGGKGDELVRRAIFSNDGRPVFVGSSDFESNTVLFIQKITF